jgi:hypothetical protein
MQIRTDHQPARTGPCHVEIFWPLWPPQPCYCRRLPKCSAWPYLVPPDVPKDRLETLRTAFMQTMQDADFRAEAVKAGLEISPTPGAEFERLVQELYRTPAAIARKAADLLH